MAQSDHVMGQAQEVQDRKTLSFDDNAKARILFGQFDEHLAVLERELHIEATSRGNGVSLTGPSLACEQGAKVLETLYQRIAAGEDITGADVEGVIKHISRVKAQVIGAEVKETREAFIDMSKENLKARARQKAIGPNTQAQKTHKLSNQNRSTQDQLNQGQVDFKAASISTAKKTIHARSFTQSAYIEAMQQAEMVFGTGPAGTGKTYLAVAYGASLLERGAVDRIILSRPAVEAGERLGFLPGDMKEKVDPYLRPLYDALYDMMPGDKVERALNSEMIEIAPLAFMRGRTLAHSVVILDEAQNTTSMQMKMFLTRLGEGSKMIITGDPSQIDLPTGQRSGLVEAMQVLSPVKEIRQIAFDARDVVRHKLVGRIVDAYDAAYKSDAP